MSANLHQAIELSGVSLQNEFKIPLPINCRRQRTSSDGEPIDLTSAQVSDIQKRVQGNSFGKKTSLDLPLKDDCLVGDVVPSDQLSSVDAPEGEPPVSLTRPTSLPGMLQPSQCHCSACCSCSPHQQNCFTPSLSLSRTAQSLSAGLDAGICYDNSGGIGVLSSVSAGFDSKTVAVDISDCSVQNETREIISHATNESVSELDQGLGHPTSSFSSSRCAFFGKLPVSSPTQPTVAETNVSNGDGVFSELNCSSSQCQMVLPAATDLQNAHSCQKPEGHQQKVTRLVSCSVVPSEFKEKLQSIKGWFQEFNDTQKNLVLRSLLEECSPSQKHLLSMELEFFSHKDCHPNCRDLLGWLPEPASLHIFSYLDPVSLCRALCVSRRWLTIANDNSLWRQLSSRLSRAGEKKQSVTFRFTDGSVNWKGLFAEKYRLRNNWIKGRCNIRTFEGHTQGVSCVQFDETRIVSGSSDKTIKLWNIRTNSQWAVQTLVGHSGTVRCLHLDGNRLVSGSTDRTIKVWDLSSQESWTSIACKVTMVGHIDTVRCLKVDADKVISGSYDKTLKVWDIKTGECRRTLSGHEAAVLCVQFDSTKIISGSCDKTIKVWTFEGNCVMTLQGHQDAVTCLQFDERRLISGSLDCTLRFWNVQNGHLINTIDWKAAEGHTRVVRCLQADSWRVVSASDDKTIKVWSLDTGQRLATLRNHTDGVTCLQFNDSVLVSGSYDKTVKLWDFSCC